MRAVLLSRRLLAAAAVLATGWLVSPDPKASGRAEAAEIVQQEPDARCALKLTGAIREGDADRFGQALQLLAPKAVVNVCLSSTLR